MEDVNPFHPEVINFMLNSVGYPVHKVEKVPGQLPRLVSGRGITFGQEEFSSVKRVTEGGFAVVYTAKTKDRTVALKVCMHACTYVQVRVCVRLTCPAPLRSSLLQWSGRWQ